MVLSWTSTARSVLGLGKVTVLNPSCPALGLALKPTALFTGGNEYVEAQRSLETGKTQVWVFKQLSVCLVGSCTKGQVAMAENWCC